MADEYRSFIGKVYGGPYSRKAGDAQVTSYALSAVGLNGDVNVTLDFWGAVPEWLKVNSLVYASGKFTVWRGENKSGDEVTKKTISVNNIENLGTSQRLSTGAPAPKGRKAERTFDEPDF